MTKDQLPEKLRNIEGLQMCDGKPVTVVLSEEKMQALESVFVPLIEKENRKGA